MQRTAGFVLGLGLAFAVFDAVAAHTPPLDTPPNANVPAPATRPLGTGIRPASSEAPEIAGQTGRGHRGTAREYMAVTAHPVATAVATRILAEGGTAADAAVAVQMVLNVVEPQSSGIGGGTMLLYYDAAAGSVRAYDGRETAPAAADVDYLRFSDGAGSAPVVPNARQSGRAVGVPGTVRVLELVHRNHGRLPWDVLFAPAVELARDGYVVGERMSASIADAVDALSRDPDTERHLLTPEGQAPAAGARLYNPELAAVFERLAQQGADAFYKGEIADGIVRKVNRPPAGATPGRMTVADIEGYRAVERAAVCAPYLRWEICGFPPPSSGGIAVAQLLGILMHTPIAEYPPIDDGAQGAGFRLDPRAIHWFSEAARLAYADRDHYVADTDFVPLPGGTPEVLLDPDYLAHRAGLIDARMSMGRAQPGVLTMRTGADAGMGQVETSHVSLVDRYGNALTMTSTVEGGFGSFMMVSGFLLNNEMTDFSARARDDMGRPIANRVEGGKRPRSSMAPTLVFERDADGSRGSLVLVLGSPGGGAIIQYVARTLVALLDWRLDPLRAVAMNNFGAANVPQTVLEANHPQTTPELVDALQQMGHDVVLRPRTSGLAVIRVGRDATGRLLEGSADPRREGVVAGD